MQRFGTVGRHINVIDLWWRVVVCTVMVLWSGGLRAEQHSWKYLTEFSEDERKNIDLRIDTPRSVTLPYFPAEPYPFTAPYTAEEMGIRAMEFPHMARWNHVQIEDFGTIMPTGYLANGKVIVLAMHVQPEGLEGYLQTSSGAVFTRWLTQDTALPENLGNQLLMVHHRTDQQTVLHNSKRHGQFTLGSP